MERLGELVLFLQRPEAPKPAPVVEVPKLPMLPNFVFADNMHVMFPAAF